MTEPTVQYRGIILGSPVFPKCRLSGPPSLRASARGMRDYFELALSLEESFEFLNLFGSADSPNQQLQAISAFASQAVDESEKGSNIVFIVYYVGHGYLAQNGNSYSLAIRETTSEYSVLDGVTCRDLLARLKKAAPKSKRLIIIDACFAGRAIGDAFTLADPQSVILANLKNENESDPWCALYCATGANSVALAPVGSKYTMFSHGLLHAMNNGNGSDRVLDLKSLDEIAWEEIKERFKHIPEKDRPILVPVDPVDDILTQDLLPVSLFVVDATTEKLVKLALEEQIPRISDDIRTRLYPDIEDFLEEYLGDNLQKIVDDQISSINAKYDSADRKINDEVRKMRAYVDSQLYLTTSRIDRVQQNKASIVETQALKKKNIFDYLIEMFSPAPVTSEGSDRKNRVSPLGTKKYRRSGSRMFGLFFANVHSEHFDGNGSGIGFKEQIGSLGLIMAFVALEIAASVVVGHYRSFFYLFTADSLANDQLNSDPRSAILHLDTLRHDELLVLAVVGVVYWGLIGLLGYRSMFKGDEYRTFLYRFLGISFNPAIVSFFFSIASLLALFSAIGSFLPIQVGTVRLVP